MDTAPAQTSSQPTSPLPPLEAFVEQLLLEKNYDGITEAIHNEMKQDLLTRVNDTINAKVIAALSDTQVAEFEKLVDSNASDEEIQKFIAGSITDSTTFITNVLMEFRRNYLGLP